MKVEEIKLAFETNVKLGLIDELSSKSTKVVSDSQKAYDLLSNAKKLFQSSLSQIEIFDKEIDKGIVSAKELGAKEALDKLQGQKETNSFNIKNIKSKIAIL